MVPTPCRNSKLLDADAQLELLKIAALSIQQGLNSGHSLQPELEQYDDSLKSPGASFVTLEIDGQLRGCIGMLEPIRPLAEDVAENAYAAAFRDPRFAPLSMSEYPKLELHISVLGPATEMAFDSEAQLLQQLVPFEDGLILQAGQNRGTFLPSVWESLPQAEIFLSHLKQKAGLAANYWSNEIRVWRYHTQSFGQSVASLTA